MNPAVPRPVLWASLAIGATLLAVVVWVTARGGQASAGPDLPVRPGMVDLRAELAKPPVARAKP